MVLCVVGFHDMKTAFRLMKSDRAGSLLPLHESIDYVQHRAMGVEDR
jgi:hypothetical protein